MSPGDKTKEDCIQAKRSAFEIRGESRLLQEFLDRQRLEESTVIRT